MASELFAALADDLAQLIRLHDREIDADVLVALRQVDFPHRLALPASDALALHAHANMAAALAGPLSLDDLAAAAIVNSFAYQAGLIATRDGIAVEKRERNPYTNLIAVRAKDQDAPWAKQLVAAYHRLTAAGLPLHG